MNQHNRSEQTGFDQQKLVGAFVAMKNENARLRRELDFLKRSYEYEIQQRRFFEDHARKSSQELDKYINLQRNRIAFNEEIQGKRGFSPDHVNNATTLPRIESRFSEGHNAIKRFEKESESANRSRSQPNKFHQDKRVDAQMLNQFHRRRHQYHEENENRQLRSRLDSVEKQLNVCKRQKNESRVSEIRQTDSEIEMLKDKLKDTQDESRRLNDQVSTLKRNELTLIDQLERKKHEIAALWRELENNKVHSLRDKAMHEQTIKEDEEKPLVVHVADRDYSAERRAIEKEYRVQLERVNNDLRQSKQELDTLKSRLSKMMGDKLSHGSPEIADLSDENRPVKLAERYIELYDNQWTDAFDSLKQEHGEDRAVEILLNILQDTMKACQEEADKQKAQLFAAVSMSTEPVKDGYSESLLKQLSDIRKASAEISAENLFKKYWKSLTGPGLNVFTYVKECFILCWLMTSQDPPVVLGKGGRHGDPLNTDVFRAYTKSGPLLDYVVWPPLCLYEGGALLCKGVAEGMNDNEEIN